MAGIPITLNFDLKAPLPLDSRLLVANTNQLNNINPKYSGMIVYAANTKKLYYLEDLNTNTWSQLGTGSFGGGISLNNVVYTSGDQTISGSKTFLATGFYYSGGFYRYDKNSTTIFEENVFINKINNQTSFGIYNHYFLKKNLPISSQLSNLPIGIRTGNIVNLFFNNSGINNSIENNILVEPTIMVNFTGNSVNSNIIPILGHPFYSGRALKKVNYNGITENVVYTTGDQLVSGSKTFINTGVYYSGGFYRYDKQSRTLFENNVFINKINNQTSFGVYNYYSLNKSLPIIGQLANLPVGIRTGNIVNLFFNNSGINNSNETNYTVEPTVMVKHTGNTLTSNIIPIIGHPFYSGRALKKISYNGLAENVVYTSGNQLISGSKTFLDNTIFNKNITSFQKFDLYNQNWSLVNSLFGRDITGRWGFSGNFPGPYIDTFDPTGSYFIGDNLYLNKDGDILVLGGTLDNTSHSFERAVYILKTGADHTWEVMQSITGSQLSANGSRLSPFGRVFEMSEDNSVLLIGQPLGFHDILDTRCGEVHIFTGSKQNGWNKKQTIVGETRSFENFGASLAISKNANTIIVGSPAFDSSPINATGRIHIFTGNKDAGWSLKQAIVGSSEELNFGASISCNHDSSIIAVGGAYDKLSYGSMSRTGFAYVYTGSLSTNWGIQQKFSGIYEEDDYNWGTLWFGQYLQINESGNILIISDPRKKEARGALYFYTGSKNSTWLKTSEVLSPLPWSTLEKVVCNHDASIVLAECGSHRWANGRDSYSLVIQKSIDYNWFIKQQIIYNNPPISPRYLGNGGLGINKLGNIFVLGSHSSFSGTFNTNGIVATFKDLEPNEFSVGNVFPESFVKIKGSTKLLGDTLLSGNIKFSGDNRPTINNKEIVVSGEAIRPDSNARLQTLEFKNSSEFALDGPLFMSSYQGSGIPASLMLLGSQGRIVDFTDTGVMFFERPRVNGSGVLLEGEFVAGGGEDAFNGNRAITLDVPGFKNINVGGNTVSGFLNNLFFPFVPATISLNPYPLQELGTTYSQVLFTGSITQNSETQISFLQYMNGDTILNTIPSPAFGSFGASFVLNLTNNATLRARVNTNNNGVTRMITGSQNVTFIAPSWHGAGVNGLITGVKNMTKYLNTKGNRTFTFDSSNNHFYYAYPNDWGLLTSIIDQNGFNITASFSNTTGNLLLADNSTNYIYRIYQSINPSSNTDFKITFNF